MYRQIVVLGSAADEVAAPERVACWSGGSESVKLSGPTDAGRTTSQMAEASDQGVALVVVGGDDAGLTGGQVRNVCKNTSG